MEEITLGTRMLNGFLSILIVVLIGILIAVVLGLILAAFGFFWLQKIPSNHKTSKDMKLDGTTRFLSGNVPGFLS